jgi:putative sigma-54 modulation protein
VSLNDTIKAYAEKKVSKLDRYFREEPTAFITFSVEKTHLCSVEITIRGGNTLLRAQTQEPDGDMRGAIDAACGYIERQILKNKTRLARKLRSDAFPKNSTPADEFEVAEEKEFNIVRTKRFAVKPMSPEEAILQMNLLDHTFFVFRNVDDDNLSIVYARRNGGYGLIETGEAT